MGVFRCIEGLVETSEQLGAAVHVCVVGLAQGQKNQAGSQGCAGPLGHG